MIKNATEFLELRTSGRQVDYLRSANDPAELQVWLEILENFPDMKVWVARNKTIPAEILEMLAKDPDSMVRHAVAMKNKLPPHLMLLLATDVDDSVRERIVYNKNVGENVLRILANDPSESVSLVARDRLVGPRGRGPGAGEK